jgi:hypothetical protein
MHPGSVQQLVPPVAQREERYRDDEMILDGMRLRAKFSVDMCKIRLGHERHRFRILAPHARAGGNITYISSSQTAPSPCNQRVGSETTANYHDAHY